MRFTQYYLDCLPQASYLIADESTGRLSARFRANFTSGHADLGSRDTTSPASRSSAVIRSDPYPP